MADISYTPGPLLDAARTTPTALWNDSSDLAELKQSISFGGVGATCNPVIAYTTISKNLDVWTPRIKAIADRHGVSMKAAGLQFSLANPAVAAERDRIFAPNIWPAEVPELRTAGVAYFDAAVALAHRITAACAVGLGLPSDFFEAFTGHSTDTMRCNWYSRVAGSPDPLPGQQRMGAHTDYGIVTVLYADRVPGLELLDKRGEWIGVVPEPGAYLVNVGDLLAQWSNDRWVSTLHRVVPPPATTDGPSLRRSIAFFHDGDWDAMIQCLPTCCSEDEPPKYAPVRALDHLLNKLVGGRAMEPAETTAHIGDRIDAVRS